MKCSWIFALCFFVTALVGCKAVDNLAASVLYPFESVNKASPVGPAPAGFEEMKLENDNGTIHGWTYAHGGATTTVVYLHGNGENVQSLYDYKFLDVLKGLGVNFVVPDYPGLGKSTGKQSEETLAAVGMQACDYARATFPGSTIVLWGRSIGTGVAMQTYKRLSLKPDKVILTSPWTTFHAMALEKSSLAKMLSIGFLAANQYDSASVAATMKTPTLIHHGTKDELIAFKLGKKLSEYFPPGVAKFKELPGRGHNDIFGDKQLWSDVREFLK